MSWLGELLGKRRAPTPSAARSWLDDVWYPRNSWTQTAAGIVVNEETALQVSSVYAAVRLRARQVASLPLHVYERQADGGKRRATNHPLYELLHNQPNPWQTSYEWREYMEASRLLRGNAYAEIRPGPRGAVDQLWPLDPDRMRVEVASSTERPRYRYRQRDGTERVLVADEVLHIRGFSRDGIVGLSPLDLMAEAVGLAKVAERHSAASLANGGAPSVVLTHASKLTPEARVQLEKSWRRAYGGDNRGGAAVLDSGLDVKPLQLTSEQVQLMEQRKFSVTDIARWFDVPPHMIGDLDRATFSNIEQQSIEFATLRLRPDLVAWEQAIRRDLIVAADRYFAEFALDGLLRGDSAARSAYYQGGIQNGWMTRNEARLLENLNPLPGLDEPLVPQNMAPASMRAPDDSEQP